MPRERRIRLRYKGHCSCCGAFLPAGSYAYHDATRKTVRCTRCPAWPTVQKRGTSARREHDRRKARDEQQLRDKWGRLGGLALALSPEKQSTRAWERGAVGEERVAGMLNGLDPAQVAVLHDRRIPGTRANVDHIVVSGLGVWVIDTKRYENQRPQRRTVGGLFRPREEKLYVGSRDCTKLVDRVLWQVEQVQVVVPGVPVQPVLCFVDSDWPLLAGPFGVRGVAVMTRRLLKKALLASPPPPPAAGAVLQALSAQFMPM